MPSCSSFGNCTSLRRAGIEMPYFGFRFPSAASCVTPQARPAPSRALGKAVNNRSRRRRSRPRRRSRLRWAERPRHARGSPSGRWVTVTTTVAGNRWSTATGQPEEPRGSCGDRHRTALRKELS